MTDTIFDKYFGLLHDFLQITSRDFQRYSTHLLKTMKKDDQQWIFVIDSKNPKTRVTKILRKIRRHDPNTTIYILKNNKFVKVNP